MKSANQLAWARGERRVCSMVRSPSPEEEDRRRLTRERGTLLKERIQHTNRVRACSAAKASGITIRFGAIVSNDSRRCEPATAVSCRRC